MEVRYTYIQPMGLMMDLTWVEVERGVKECPLCPPHDRECWGLLLSPSPSETPSHI